MLFHKLSHSDAGLLKVHICNGRSQYCEAVDMIKILNNIEVQKNKTMEFKLNLDIIV